jgi:uncharacterized protein (DUF2062 family)
VIGTTQPSATVLVRPIADGGALRKGRRVRPNAQVLACILAVGLLFGLPHLLIPHILGSDRPYTPFAVSGVSALTYDETSSYAAYVNYALRHLTPAYDVDVFENRNIPVPAYSVVPSFAVAALAAVSGGVDRAFTISDFFLPPLALIILYALLIDFVRDRAIALFGALATLLISFGPRNILTIPILLIANRTGEVVQPLEYSRLFHPEFSFTLFGAGLLFLWRTFRSGQLPVAVLAGTVGALLFYTYFYYWPIWLGGCVVLLIFASYLAGRPAASLLVTSAVTSLGSIPFWITYVQSEDYANFAAVLGRHTSETGHLPEPAKLAYAFGCCAAFAAIATFHMRVGSPVNDNRLDRRRALLFFTAVLASGVVALNMEVFTGLNVEAMLHFPNRFFQPFLMLAAFALLGPPVISLIQTRGSQLQQRWAGRAITTGALCLIAIAGVRQVLVSYNVAQAHEYDEEHRTLFTWLSSNSRLDDVVLAVSKDINDLVPVYTPNRVFVPNGERTSASTKEIGERFLIAMKLLKHNRDEVRAMLAQDRDHGEPPLGLTYTFFLFLGVDNLRLDDAQIEAMLGRFEGLDLAQALAGRRVDYIYGRGVEVPADVRGWKFNEVYANRYGRVWQAQVEESLSQAP